MVITTSSSTSVIPRRLSDLERGTIVTSGRDRGW